MQQLRLLLLPFSLIYWLITTVRNYLYNVGIFKSHTFPLPVIAIGNLSTGGTGKTPQAEYLIRLLTDRYRVTTLSRGYKRKSKGFVLSSEAANAHILGDEPYQFYYKFPGIRVAVDANRKNGIEQLMQLKPAPQVILLDDAYQHRRVKAGFYILLTVYNDLYINDFLLPAGNLREGRSGANRATIIIVTKCPPGLTITDREKITSKLNVQPGQEVFFSFIDYEDKIYSENEQLAVTDITNVPKLLIAGIAKPKPFFEYLKGDTTNAMTFADHHDFSEADIRNIEEKAGTGIIVTTEKDYVRLRGRIQHNRLFYLPIKSSFIAGKDKFDKLILQYVESNL